MKWPWHCWDWHVPKCRGQWCGDIELITYLANAVGRVRVSGSSTYVRITHERMGSSSNRILKYAKIRSGHCFRGQSVPTWPVTEKSLSTGSLLPGMTRYIRPTSDKYGKFHNMLLPPRQRIVIHSFFHPFIPEEVFELFLISTHRLSLLVWTIQINVSVVTNFSPDLFL